MDLLVLVPAPLITLAVQLIKFFGMPSNVAPWVALALAVISTIVIHYLGVSDNALEAVIAFLVAWLGSMGTWEGLKNTVLGRLPHAAPANPS